MLPVTAFVARSTSASPFIVCVAFPGKTSVALSPAMIDGAAALGLGLAGAAVLHRAARSSRASKLSGVVGHGAGRPRGTPSSARCLCSRGNPTPLSVPLQADGPLPSRQAATGAVSTQEGERHHGQTRTTEAQADPRDLSRAR